MLYQEKYIKYKNKYINLKNLQKGGLDCDNERVFNNIHGTCWMISIQMIFSFGDVTSNSIECIMKSLKMSDKEKYINTQIQIVENDCNLKKVLPNNIFNIDKINYLKIIIDKFIDRYNSKVFNINKKEIILDDTKNPKRCELLILNNFKELFNEYILDKDTSGGDMDEQYLFTNILSIFFLNYKVSFINYYPNNFNNIEYDDQNDIGILISTIDHVCCFFICNNIEKYCNDNDNKIYTCNWKKLLKKTSDINNLYIKENDCIIILNKEQYKCYENKSEISKVLCLTIISKNIKINNLDNQINNIINKRNLDTITDSKLLNILGEIYEFGCLGIKKNYKKAIEYYKISADKGNSHSQYSLAMIYYYSKGEEQNHTNAFKYFSLTAEQGNNSALYQLGLMYYNGHSVKPSFPTAIEYFTLAADQENIEAQDFLGNYYYKMYMEYKDVKKYYKYVIKYYNNAIKYNKLAVQHGNSNSKLLLQKLYNLSK
jgi:hypothetical protein